MIVDTCIDHVPEALYDDPRLLNGFLSSVPHGYGEIAYVGQTEKGARQMVVEKPKGCQNLNYVEGDYSLEAKLRAMDECGVDVGIIKLPVWQEWLDVKTCKLVNDNLADQCARSNGRLVAVATVPPWDAKENFYELERCIRELGMCGVQLACHYGELYLDDMAFRPMLREISRLDIPVYVRHTPLPVQWQKIYEFTNLRRLLGRVIDQSIAVGRELFCGLFDELPNLRFVHTVLGGCWYANYEAMVPPKSTREESMQRLSTNDRERILRFLHENLYFEATHPHTWGKKQVESAIEICGADHILFGSSFPVFYNWMPDGVAFLKSLDITEAERALVMGGNAARIFRLEG